MTFAKTPFKRIAIGLLLSAGLLTACGGGDGDGGRFSGNYTLTLQKFSDTCLTGLPYQLQFTPTVRQDGRKISVKLSDIDLHGEVDADDAGFTTTYSDGSGGTAALVYQVTENPNQFSAGFAIAATAGRLSCVVSYGGLAERV
ncbi:hypothetical protein [Hydrogenophaga electricum]|uniref:Lipoprotein n=1 Tax=Hydrogenophaga electricum TaxID=1230953 RepID=A0ABQ6C483_9BURK|nr:hypothetical protein [Hydrogenophaga electricum]GLS14750.1 hypothetical protein GCM10007935_21820 [Hydrogenophaga electricum]